MDYKVTFYISNYIYQISLIQALHTSQHTYIEETRKIDT